MRSGSISRSCTVVVLLAASIPWAAPHARAQSRRGAITTVGCEVDLVRGVESALDVELTDAGPDARRAVEEGTLRCAITCDELGYEALVTGGERTLEQRIDDRGPGAARRLAIALVELLEAAALPIVVEPTAEPPPEDPAPPRVIEPFRARLRLAGGAWLGGEPLLPLGTLRLGAELAPTSNVAFVLEATGALGAITIDDARLDARLLGAASSVRFGAEVGPFWLGAGPAIHGGAVFWQGTPLGSSGGIGRDGVGGWLGLGAVAVALWRMPGLPLRVGLEVEGGGIAYSSDALVRGARAQRIGGGWLELRVAIDVALE